MLCKTSWNIKKLEFDSKIQTEVLLLLSLSKIRNRPIPKKFPIKTISERTDSSIKNLGQVESVLSKSVLIRKFLLSTDLCTVAFMQDLWFMQGKTHFEFFSQTLISWCCRQFCLSYSTSPWLFTLESVLSEIVLIGNFFGMDSFRFLYSGNRR